MGCINMRDFDFFMICSLNVWQLQCLEIKRKTFGLDIGRNRLNLGQICGNLTLSLIITFLDWRVKFLKKMCRWEIETRKLDTMNAFNTKFSSWIVCNACMNFSESRVFMFCRRKRISHCRSVIFWGYICIFLSSGAGIFCKTANLVLLVVVFHSAASNYLKTHVEVVRNCWAEACRIIAHVSGVQAVVSLIKYSNFVTFRCH